VVGIAAKAQVAEQEFIQRDDSVLERGVGRKARAQAGVAQASGTLTSA